jgi:hypothetical protein
MKINTYLISEIPDNRYKTNLMSPFKNSLKHLRAYFILDAQTALYLDYKPSSLCILVGAKDNKLYLAS